jgi:mono/diheme cytochrome c family protein
MKSLPRNLLLTLICATTLTMSACMSTGATSSAACPQLRNTELAPAQIAAKQNPLPVTADNISSGKDLYQSSAKPVACKECHGKLGDGNGPMSSMFEPPPRNFTCALTMSTIPDGQLYWIIKDGSIGTSMPAFDKLNDTQIWQLVMYIRHFAKQASLTQASNNASTK